MTEDIGIENIRKLVVRPLTGLKVGAFYGCHLIRPQKDIRWESAEDPHVFEDLLSALGATPVNYRGRVMCCGFPILFVKEPTANRIAATQIRDARAHGADAMATPCPLCHISLDTFQNRAEAEVGQPLDMPIFHLPQMIGLAMGADPKDLGLPRHMVSTKAALEKIGTVGVPAIDPGLPARPRSQWAVRCLVGSAGSPLRSGVLHAIPVPTQRVILLGPGT